MFTTIVGLVSSINAAAAIYGWHRSSRIANANAWAFKHARLAKHVSHARRSHTLRQLDVHLSQLQAMWDAWSRLEDNAATVDLTRDYYR